MLTQNDLDWKRLKDMSDGELINLVETAQRDARWVRGPSWYPGIMTRTHVFTGPHASGDVSELLFDVLHTGYAPQPDIEGRAATAAYIVALHMASRRLLALARRGLETSQAKSDD